MLLTPRFVPAALLSLLLALPVLAEAGMSIEGKPKATFFATGSPGFMSIEGVTSTMKLADDGTHLTFTVPMATVDSGISLRDEHMNKNYVQIDKYPDVVIAFPKADVKWPTAAAPSSTGTVKGTFTAHGVTQPANIEYTLTKTKTGYRVKSKFAFNTTSHGMVIEPYMGISFDPNMYATVNVDLVDAP